MSGGELQVDLQQYPKSWKLAAHGKAFTKQDVVLMPVRSAFGPAMLKQAMKGKSLSTSSGLLQLVWGSWQRQNPQKTQNGTIDRMD